jgi:hypothetical protein
MDNCQAKLLLLFVIAYVWDTGSTQLPDVEKTMYASPNEAWKECKTTDFPPYPSPIVYPPNATPYSMPSSKGTSTSHTDPAMWPA